MREGETLLVVHIISDMLTADMEGLMFWFLRFRGLAHRILFLNILRNQQRVLWRVLDQITILRQLLKSTGVYRYITNSLQTFRAKASSFLPKNILFFPCKTYFLFSSPLWFWLITQSCAASTAVEQPLFRSNTTGTWTLKQGLPVPGFTCARPPDLVAGQVTPSQV